MWCPILYSSVMQLHRGWIHRVICMPWFRKFYTDSKRRWAMKIGDDSSINSHQIYRSVWQTCMTSKAKLIKPRSGLKQQKQQQQQAANITQPNNKQRQEKYSRRHGKWENERNYVYAWKTFYTKPSNYFFEKTNQTIDKERIILVFIEYMLKVTHKKKESMYQINSIHVFNPLS